MHVGLEKMMVYLEDGVGAFYLSVEEQENQKHDCKAANIKTKKKTMSGLREELLKLGIE